MDIVVERLFALQLYSLARQAERSIDFGLHSATMWKEMTEFYDDAKRSRIESAERAIRTLLSDGKWCALNREDLRERSILHLPRCLLRLAMNCIRTSWRFRTNEIAFLDRTFAALIAFLQSREMPELERVVDLRLDLAACQWIIADRLMGLSALRTAQQIEHFGQAAHVPSKKWEDIFPDPLDGSPSEGSMHTRLRRIA